VTRIAVYGTGGVGGYFGARLARAGAEVHFIARGAHLQALREHGLRVRSVKGDFQADDTFGRAESAQNPPAMYARASAVVIRWYDSVSSPERTRAATVSATRSRTV
jgi:ketopantoate reductase